MKNPEEKEYIKIFNLLQDAKKDKNSAAIDELAKKFDPLIIKYSTDSISAEFNSGLNTALKHTLHKAITEFDIDLVDN